MSDVTLSITIPEANVDQVKNAFIKASGARIDMNAHKSTETKEFNANWNFEVEPRLDATITEMIFIDDIIPDGLYLLQIQIPALMLDASPSRPYIYPLL